MSGAERPLLPYGRHSIDEDDVAAVVATRPMPPTEEIVVLAPVVQVATAAPGSHRFVVRAQGTVMPRTESELVAQVAGEIVWISAALVSMAVVTHFSSMCA